MNPETSWAMWTRTVGVGGARAFVTVMWAFAAPPLSVATRAPPEDVLREGHVVRAAPYVQGRLNARSTRSPSRRWRSSPTAWSPVPGLSWGAVGAILTGRPLLPWLPLGSGWAGLAPGEWCLLVPAGNGFVDYPQLTALGVVAAMDHVCLVGDRRVGDRGCTEEKHSARAHKNPGTRTEWKPHDALSLRLRCDAGSGRLVSAELCCESAVASSKLGRPLVAASGVTQVLQRAPRPPS